MLKVQRQHSTECYMGCSPSFVVNSPVSLSPYLPIADVACPPICIVDSVTITTYSATPQFTPHLLDRLQGELPKEIHIVLPAIDRNITLDPFLVSRNLIHLYLLQILILKFSTDKFFIINLTAKFIPNCSINYKDISALCNAINK